MKRIQLPFKVAMGYAAIIAVMAVAVWLMAVNTSRFVRMSDVEDEYLEQRDLLDSLVGGCMDIAAYEYSITMGIDRWEQYSMSVDRTLDIAKRLSTITDTVMTARIDSLAILTANKREHTLKLMRLMGQYDANAALKDREQKFRNGLDSVMVNATQRNTVYSINKSKRGFFRRLTDAFRGSRSDTVNVSHAVSDTSVDVAKDVAKVLAEVQIDNERRLKAANRQWKNEVKTQQKVGVEMADKTQQLLTQLRTDGHIRLRQAFAADYEARWKMFIDIALLTAVALVAVVLLLWQVWRDYRRSERYRRNLEEAREQTERLTMTITHDIKAPAASILGYIDLMDEYMAGGDWHRVEGCIKNVRMSASDLMRFVTALLEHRRMENGTAEVNTVTFSVHKLVGDCISAMMPIAKGKGLRLTSHINDTQGNLYTADAFRLRQILDNLVSNALKYTDNGEVTVKAEIHDGRMLHIDVKDTGRGMAPDETEHIFDAFKRLGGNGGTDGVGLGLAITNDFVNLLGGTISVVSAKGSGTTFSVAVPVEPTANAAVQNTSCSDMAEDSTATDGTENTSDTAACRKILIVDDDPLQLSLLKEQTARMSAADGNTLNIHTANTAAKAIQAIDAECPDVILMDVEMPEMGGEQLMESVKTQHPEIRIIAMTAHDPGIRQQLLKAGFSDCLFKPIDRQRLMHSLHLYDFSSLTSFAAGDPDAAADIMRSFVSQLELYAKGIAKTISNTQPDRPQLAHIAHKSMPTLTMTGFRTLQQLTALTPEHIDTLTDKELKVHAAVILAEIRKIINGLNSHFNND